MEPAVEQALIVNNPPCASGDVKCNAALFVQNSQDENLVQDAFWQQSLTAPDQLRQRVKYALSQIFVISGNNTSAIQNMPRGEAGLLRHARQRRLRQLPPAPSRRDPQPDDGPVPLHAGQRQGQRHHRSRRKLRARSAAALHHRPLAVERRRHAAARRQRQPHPHLFQYRRQGPRRRLHRLQLEHPRRLERQRVVKLLRLRRPRLRRRAAAHAELPQPPLHGRKGISRRHHSRIRQSRSRGRSQDRARHTLQSSRICRRSFPSR